MTRAVIKLSGDLSPVMLGASRLIDGCGYSSETNVMGFNYKGFGVIVEAKSITINNADNKAIAREVMRWLQNIIKIADERKTEQNVK